MPSKYGISMEELVIIHKNHRVVMILLQRSGDVPAGMHVEQLQKVGMIRPQLTGY